MQITFNNGSITATAESIKDIRALLALEGEEKPAEVRVSAPTKAQRGRPAKYTTPAQIALRERLARDRKREYMREYWKRRQVKKR
jgi:hypothetical protein